MYNWLGELSLWWSAAIAVLIVIVLFILGAVWLVYEYYHVPVMDEGARERHTRASSYNCFSRKKHRLTASRRRQIV